MTSELYIPRPNAIRFAEGDTQFVTAADPTWLWKPTIPANAIHRCWQYHPFTPPVPSHVPYPPLGAPASVLEYEYEERTVGWPQGCASEKIVAST